MEKHRVRIAKSIDGRNDHIFVEFEDDLWIEVATIPSHDAIHQFLTVMRATNIYLMTRAFEIGIIKDWKENGTIE